MDYASSFSVIGLYGDWSQVTLELHMKKGLRITAKAFVKSNLEGTTCEQKDLERAKR